MISRATCVPIERAADCTAERTMSWPVVMRPRLDPPPFHQPPIVWPISPRTPGCGGGCWVPAGATGGPEDATAPLGRGDAGCVSGP